MTIAYIRPADGKKFCATCAPIVLGCERCDKLRGTCAACGRALDEDPPTEPDPNPPPWGD